MYICLMNACKHFLVIILTVFYLFLTTGVTLLSTHCLCSDSMNISLYTESESCFDAIPGHICCEDTNSCNDCDLNYEHHSCCCGEPIITYLKLTNHLNEDSNLEYPMGKQLYLSHFPKTTSFQLIVASSEVLVYPEYSPPESLLYGRFLITFLNQRKIALTA